MKARTKWVMGMEQFSVGHSARVQNGKKVKEYESNLDNKVVEINTDLVVNARLAPGVRAQDSLRDPKHS
jgi:hypothetical protein